MDEGLKLAMRQLKNLEGSLQTYKKNYVALNAMLLDLTEMCEDVIEVPAHIVEQVNYFKSQLSNEADNKSTGI